MPRNQSSHPPTGVKPAKPYVDFPLFPHANGTWAKKIRGKMHYFGIWAEPNAALKKYLEEKDALHSGTTPRPDTRELTVKDLANHFLNAKQTLVDSGELSPRTWTDYRAATDMLVSEFGKNRLVMDLAPDDFAALRKRMTEQWGPVRVGNVVQRVRCIFKHAFDAGLTDRPLRFGPSFTRPSKKTMRLHRADKGPNLFSREEVHKLVDATGTPMRAMILLGINAGFGNADCGSVPRSAVDLDRGMVDFPRPKTGIARRCPLWPETVESIKEALAKRQTPKDQADAELLFITKRGLSWYKDTSDNPISKEMAKLLKALGLNGRKGLGYYTLRHTFRTVADASKDQAACDHIMGHEGPHMSSIYRETISDERLRAVTAHVRGWLFGT